MFELRVGLLELRVMFAGPRFEMAVVDEQNGRNGEQGDCGHGDREREPALIGRSGAETERSRAEAGAAIAV